MGLDIGAMSGLVNVSDKYYPDEDWEIKSKETDDHVKGDFYVANLNDDFKPQAIDMKDRAVYTFDEYLHVRAGSYGGYSRWRFMLCNMALGVDPDVVWENPEKYKDAPFFELINFSDCEGCIGTIVSQKLYGDFLEYKDRAKTYADRLPDDFDGHYWHDKYVEWTEAFQLASKDGCVDFH